MFVSSCLGDDVASGDINFNLDQQPSILPASIPSLFTTLTPSTDTAVNWISGPEKASLGTVADIEIPDGYRLIGKGGARALLERTKNPVPDGLIGILAPASGHWWAVLEFSDTGYLKDVDKQLLDPAAILTALQNRTVDKNLKRVAQGLAPIASVDWERPPVYDGATHSLEWAVQAGTQTAKAINYTVLLFGRNGVLEITAVQPVQNKTDLAPLMQLVRNITFKEGQGYKDYQSGDAVASISLQDLIVDDERPASANVLARAGWLARTWGIPLMAGGMVVVVCLVYLRVRRHKAGQKVHTNGHLEAAAESKPLAVKNGNGSNGNGNGNGKRSGWGDLLKELEKTLNGASNGNGKHGHRKRVFNYAKFYTDFVMMSPGAVNGAVPLNGKSSRVAKEAPIPAPDSKPEGLTANMELIACHRALIEEQKRLIQQQAKLIEEKSKLIEEQNEFLGRQSSAMKDQYFLKLE
jgi:uncharacterized membrane-anchored protein